MTELWQSTAHNVTLIVIIIWHKAVGLE